jgi:glycosyltransferase involved in cell wall biosynthesis
MEIFFLNKSILLISPERWDHLFISKHHYAIALAKQNTVFFLNPPGHCSQITKTDHQNLFIVDYTPFPRGLRYFPDLIRKYFLKQKFQALKKLTNSKFDCIWSFDNSVFFDFSIFGMDILKISHIVDYTQNFQFSKAASTATLCFGVSQNIVEKLLTCNPNSFLVPHGVSVGQSVTTHIQLPGTNKRKAVYAGNLDSIYIDQPLVRSLVKNHPDVDFIFLGPGGDKLPRGSNIYFPGVVDQDKIGAYLEKADVLLILYDTLNYPDQLTNAHKVLEYLNAGVVTVSSFVSDYRDKESLLEMAKTRLEFLEIFKHVITNLDVYNHMGKRKARKEYALKNTYAERLNEIQKIVWNVYGKPVAKS